MWVCMCVCVCVCVCVCMCVGVGVCGYVGCGCVGGIKYSEFSIKSATALSTEPFNPSSILYMN